MDKITSYFYSVASLVMVTVDNHQELRTIFPDHWSGWTLLIKIVTSSFETCWIWDFVSLVLKRIRQIIQYIAASWLLLAFVESAAGVGLQPRELTRKSWQRFCRLVWMQTTQNSKPSKSKKKLRKGGRVRQFDKIEDPCRALLYFLCLHRWMPSTKISGATMTKATFGQGKGFHQGKIKKRRKQRLVVSIVLIFHKTSFNQVIFQNMGTFDVWNLCCFPEFRLNWWPDSL